MTRKIELKATGETITFISQADKSNEAIDGRIGLDCGNDKIILEPAQSYTVPVNTLHRCYSIDGKEIKFKAVFKPALNIEYLLTEIFESCNRNNGKDPSLFDACHVLSECRVEYFFGHVPDIIQKTLFSATAWLGKFFGLVKAKSIENFNR